MRQASQLPITWTAPPRARDLDGGGSHEAAERVTRDGSADAQAMLALELVRRWPGSTSRELAEAWAEHQAASGVGVYQSSRMRYILARRLPELRANGLVRNGEKRECREAGIVALTWWAVRQ